MPLVGPSREPILGHVAPDPFAGRLGLPGIVKAAEMTGDAVGEDHDCTDRRTNTGTPNGV